MPQAAWVPTLPVRAAQRGGLWSVPRMRRRVSVTSTARPSGTSPPSSWVSYTEKSTRKLAQQWSLATALSLLVWFVFAPQCLSTLATVRRETDSWRLALLMAAYLFALAYGASWLTYRLALAWGGG